MSAICRYQQDLVASVLMHVETLTCISGRRLTTQTINLPCCIYLSTHNFYILFVGPFLWVDTNNPIIKKTNPFFSLNNNTNIQQR